MEELDKLIKILEILEKQKEKEIEKNLEELKELFKNVRYINIYATISSNTYTRNDNSNITNYDTYYNSMYDPRSKR